MILHNPLSIKVQGAKAFSRQHMGAIKAGNRADLVLLDGQAMSYPYLWPGHDAYTAVLQRARSEHVKTVICRGQVLLDQGKITQVDESQIVSKLQQVYGALWTMQSQERRILIDELKPYT